MEFSFNHFFYLLGIFFLHLFRHGFGLNITQKIIDKYYTNFFKRIQIRSKLPDANQFNFEKKWVRNSQWSDVLVYGICFFLIKFEYTNITEKISWMQLGLLVALFPLQDIYFYVVHRILHLKWIYKKIHIIHHKSILTTPYTSFSAHPIEKFIELMIYPFIMLIFPIHPITILLFAFLSSILNILGLSGFLLSFFHAAVWAALTFLIIWRLVRSTHGRGFLSVRDDEVAAEAMGINTTQMKVRAFVLSSFFAGVAGSLFAHFANYLNPSTFSFLKSVDALIIVVLGGMGSLTGSVIAAIFITVLPEALRPLQDITGIDLRLVIYALALILLMLLRPTGLMGSKELPQLWRRDGKSA